MTARICILDYGMGNLRSVEKALEHVGATAGSRADPDDGPRRRGIDPARRRRLPEGDGAACAGFGLDELIAERHEAGVPLLGICLGLQLLFDSTTELGGGAGARPAARARSRSSTRPGSRCRTSAGRRSAGSAPRRWPRGSRAETPFYFVHSFAPRPQPAEHRSAAPPTATASPAVAERDNVFGVQFHPEKSSAAGLRLLSNFAGICASVARLAGS